MSRYGFYCGFRYYQPVTDSFFGVWRSSRNRHENDFHKEARRLKDKGSTAAFDPVNQHELYSDEDLMNHFGLRMIISMSKDVQYTCLFKLNNLIVRV